jgi:hypothetical protein
MSLFQPQTKNGYAEALLLGNLKICVGDKIILKLYIFCKLTQINFNGGMKLKKIERLIH